MWLIICGAVVVLFIYLLTLKPFKYWKEKNILYVKPRPIVGNMGSFVFQRRAISELAEDLYKSFPQERYFGFYQFLTPTLAIRDPDLIKRIAVSEFEAFPEHRAFVPEDVDPLVAKNLFNLPGGDRWHNMRSIVSPSFTSCKMKIMFSLLTKCATQFVTHFEKQDGIVTVEMKDVFTRFTNDVIATTAFGVTCDSLENRDNEFYLMGKDLSNFSGWKGLKMFLYAVSPALMSIFKITILSKQVDTFFRNLIKETLSMREQNGIVRPDMIQLLIEARKGHLKLDDNSNIPDSGYAVVQESKIVKSQKLLKMEITDEDITAQAVVFFLAGFDTFSNCMCFAAYELALNPDVQEKLLKEVDQVLADRDDGQVSYEALLGMKYMDLVITETLRKWPPITAIDRIAAKPFTIEPKLPWEKLAHFDAGTLCSIPIYPIHRDPKYYPDPEKFDPERFNEDNKHLIKPYTYLPFGAGPRSCIGSRYALLGSKLILFNILSKFEIVRVNETPIPLVLSKKELFPGPEKGFWLGLKPRKE